MTVRPIRLVDYLWIPLVLVFMYPVLRYSGSHFVQDPEDLQQGPLFIGRSELDSLLQESLGRPVIVNFWATWCSPCVGELPEIDDLYRSMDGSVDALAVNIGDPRLETLLRFREDFILSMPVVWLNETESSRIRSDWNLPDLLPMTVILDPQGGEAARAAGARDQEYFRMALSGTITEDTISVAFDEEGLLHINVVGPASDSLTLLLLETGLELAGEEGVDAFDPSVPADSQEMQALLLPFTGFPYAQPCVGSACGRLARTPEELRQSVEMLID